MEWWDPLVLDKELRVTPERYQIEHHKYQR